MTAIFREYSADALERQYMPTHWPNVDIGQTIDRWDEWSKAFHQRVNVKADNLYGFTPRQSIDMLVPSAGSAPVLAFIHGGYWQYTRFGKQSYSFCVEQLVEAGALVAMIEHDLCPNTSMDALVAQVRNACAWIWRSAADFGGDPERFHVTGHSAGGHLSAMMAATDWAGYQNDLPSNMIKSIVPISGLFELEPLRLSSLNLGLHLNKAEAERNSPSNLKPTTRLPITVAVGGAESDEFRRQSRDFVETWRNEAGSIDYLETPNENHFTIIEGMTNRGHSLTATLLRHLRL